MAQSGGRLQGPARVLVIADEPTAGFVALTLNHGLYTVETTDDVIEAKTRIAVWKPHLLVICVDLRSGDPRGLIAARIRARRTPTIVVTKRGDLRTKLDAFERGADDFVTVPISAEELVARALAL